MNRRASLRLRLRCLFGTATALRGVLLSGIIAATTLVLLTTVPATAAPDPDSTPGPGATAPATPGGETGRPPTQKELEAVEEFWREQAKVLSEAGQREMLRQRAEKINKLMPANDGQLGVFKVRDANHLPLSVYTVRSDTGDLIEWELGVLNLGTELLFLGTKWTVAFSCWLLTWALGFGLAKLLMAPVLAVANALHTRVIMEMGLPSVFLSVCGLICLCRIFFGNRTRGWADATVSIVLSGLTATLLSSPPALLLDDETGALAAARGLSLSVAAVIVDAQPDLPTEELPPDGRPGLIRNKVGAPIELSPAQLSRPLTNALAETFVSTPAQLLQYGQTFDGKCAEAYTRTRIEQLAYDHAIDERAAQAKQIGRWLSYDPSGVWHKTTDLYADIASDFVSDHLGAPPMEKFEKQCVKGNLAVAKKASGEKLVCALFLLLAALVMAALVTWVCVNFLAAQARIAIAAITGEAVLVAATIPGPGRTWLWDWAGNVLRDLMQLLTSVVFLAIFVVIVHTLLEPSPYWDGDLTLRFVVVDIVCVGAFLKRKKISARSQQTADNFRRRMATSLIGGGPGGSGAAAGSSPRSQVSRRGVATSVGRTVVRAALVGTALAQRDPIAAAGYAMPRTLGAVTLAHRINRRTRRTPTIQPAGRTRRHGAHRPGTRPGGQQPGTRWPNTNRTIPPRPTTPPPEPTSPPRPANAPTNVRRPLTPRTPPVQTPGSARQQQLRQRLNRRAPATRRPRP